jgi:hypothetical protein
VVNLNCRKKRGNRASSRPIGTVNCDISKQGCKKRLFRANNNEKYKKKIYTYTALPMFQ